MFLTINETTYRYEKNGHGEPVVLLHGFTGTAETWEAVVSDSLDKFQTLRLDLPGHGQTSSDTPKTMQGFCNDLTGILNYFQWDKVHLVGYSMGGRTALSFALNYPDRVRSLILESASPGLSDKADRQDRVKRDETLARRIESAGIEAFVNYWENLPLFASQKQLPENVRKRLRNERLSHSEKGLAQSLRYMGTGAQPSWWHDLSELSVPVLLVTGEWDQKFIDLNKAMEKLIPEAEHRIVEQAGHAIHVEQPAIFGRIISEFLKTVENHNIS